MSEISKWLTPERVVFLQHTGKEKALRELVERTVGGLAGLDAGQAFAAIWERESTVSSWIAPGIAIPHARLPGLGRFILSLGRSEEGILYDALDGQPVHLVFLILGDQEQPDQHIQLLAEVARLLKIPGVQPQLLSSRSPAEIHAFLTGLEEVPAGTEQGDRRRSSRVMLDCASAVARRLGAAALLLDADALGELELLRGVPVPEKIIPVVRNRSRYGEKLAPFREVIELPFPGLSHTGNVELSILLAVSRGILESGDRVVSVSGRPGSGCLDTIRMVEVGAELPTSLSGPTALPLGDIEAQILERVLQISLDLAREGREGKPVGALFVLGDYEQVLSHSRQMIMNPFRGYADAEKNILDPSLEETIKEFATLDGAFILKGDGTIMSAGAYLRPELHPERSILEVPAGLGARHTAAAAITAVTSAVSVVVSQSTGNVSLFIQGKLGLVLQKPR